MLNQQKKMRIGFTTIYSWRPHVEHLFYLSELLREAGHETLFLTCEADLPTCYTHEMRDIRPSWQECLMCRAGNIRSYTKYNVSSIKDYTSLKHKLPKDSHEWVYSSASTLGRFESDEDYEGLEFDHLTKKLHPILEITYSSAKNWILNNNLDAICVFNGRIDATRAIFEAAHSVGIRVLSIERTWFGNGLQIYPDENCLGLSSVNKLMVEWKDKPLSQHQAAKAASYIASRFLKKNTTEWRMYNAQSEFVPWPIENSDYKILLIPNSRNEVWGHPDWSSGWKNQLEAYDAIINHLKLQSEDMILRCHPNWGEKIGKRDGQHIEKYYSDWAKERNILTISSNDKTSTLGLIQQSDAIVIASGSSALEAGALGKQIIATAGSIYQKSGMRTDVCNPEQLNNLYLYKDQPETEQDVQKKAIIRQTLRFCYTMTHRIPQFVDYVNIRTPTKFIYKKGADCNRLIKLLRTGELKADDTKYSANNNAETEFIELIQRNKWLDIYHRSQAMKGTKDTEEYLAIRRRSFYALIDVIRHRIKRGDL